jgi:hypothetical protein
LQAFNTGGVFQKYWNNNTSNNAARLLDEMVI